MGPLPATLDDLIASRGFMVGSHVVYVSHRNELRYGVIKSWWLDTSGHVRITIQEEDTREMSPEFDRVALPPASQ